MSNKKNNNYHLKKEKSIDKDWIKTANIKELLNYAEQKKLQSISITSIRRIYSSVLKIKAQLDNGNKEWKRELFLLKPRVIYLSSKEKKGTMLSLKNDIVESIEAIKELNEEKQKEEEATKAFCYFMESVVAYHKSK
ncbi:MAG: type III-A CRISPR-associated protein Csm2 [Bdellovibrionales bacterium]|nr:type III-A CRISPR-associated protein Csm2 [Bdellovibrionales bacterium]